MQVRVAFGAQVLWWICERETYLIDVRSARFEGKALRRCLQDRISTLQRSQSWDGGNKAAAKAPVVMEERHPDPKVRVLQVLGYIFTTFCIRGHGVEWSDFLRTESLFRSSRNYKLCSASMKMGYLAYFRHIWIIVNIVNKDTTYDIPSKLKRPCWVVHLANEMLFNRSPECSNIGYYCHLLPFYCIFVSEI